MEILVAITILAVASGSLLHAFLTSARINTKAKEQQRVTTAAQSIMEGLKAYTLEDICWQFNNVAGHDFNIYSAVGNRREIPAGGASAAVSIRQWEDGGITKREFAPDGDDQFAFVLQNISYEGQFYDARVEIQPAVGSAPKQVYYAPEMDAATDGVWKSPQGLDASAQVLIYANVLDKLNELDEFYEYEMTNLDTEKIVINKLTTVSVSEAGGTYTASVKCEYSYQTVDYPYYDAAEVEHLWSSEDTEPFAALAVLPETVFYSGTALENLYLYYYPSYGSGLSEVPITSDKICITDTSAGSKNVYLVKQITPGLDESGKIRLLTMENSYTPVVTGSGSLALHHNLDTNLANSASSTGAYTLSGFSGTDSTFLRQEEEHLLYEVKVSIYEPGTVAIAEAAGWIFGDALFELDGSINGK